MKIYNGFYKVSIPIPVPLKTVNCYLTKSEAGWHLIDTGYFTKEGKMTWLNVFQTLNISPQDVVEIVVTHYHPDHIGLAGWLQEYTQAPVKISSESKRMVEHFWINNKEVELFEQYAYQHGMKSKTISKILKYLHYYPEEFISSFPEFTLIEEGERFKWSEEYVAIETPGHADGHLVFYSSTSSTLLGADLLLPQITPNVGFFPGTNNNPLQAFFTSLEKMKQYELDLVLPGHREVYKNGNQRIKQLIGHHNDRLREILNLLDKPYTAQEISEKLFPFLSIDSEPVQLLFALEESLAHLIYLEQEGYIFCEEKDDGVIIYNSERS